MILPETRRKVNVIGTDSDRIKCEECGKKEMHIYKLDPSLYFCGNCAYKVPVVKVRRETTVEAVDGDNSINEPKTFIASIPWRRTPGRKGIFEDVLRKKGLRLTDFYEIGLD